jgi:hypothetical protein
MNGSNNTPWVAGWPAKGGEISARSLWSGEGKPSPLNINLGSDRFSNVQQKAVFNKKRDIPGVSVTRG